MTITLLIGDCREMLATLPEQSVQMCVTSPPYYGLRKYTDDAREIGREETPQAYIAALVEVFRAVRRVLRDDGTLWINIGDSYNSNSQHNHGKGGDMQHRHLAPADGWAGHRPMVPGLKPKDLIGIPWRLAFALQDDGWYLRSDIIWHKPNPMPESVTDRPARAHEYVFLLSKSARYFYDSAAIAEPAQIHAAVIPNQTVGTHRPDRNDTEQNGTRNARTVWTISTRAYSEAHFATFPEDLAERCIRAGSSAQACEVCGAAWVRVVEREKGEAQAHERPKRTAGMDSKTSTLSMSGGSKGWQELGSKVRDLGFRPACTCPDATGSARSTVLDPFMGSGTTARVCERLQRDAIGIDLSYQELQDKRTDKVQVEMFV